MQTLQTAFDNTSAKETVDALTQRVDATDSAKEHLQRSARRITNTVTALEEKVQTLIDKPSDPAIDILRGNLERVTTQQSSIQTSVGDAQRNAASAKEATDSFDLQMTSLRALVDVLEHDVDGMDTRLGKIPVQVEYNALKYRIDKINDDKNDMVGTLQTMSESAKLLDREVYRTILKPPDPVIAQMRRDLSAVIARQENIEKSLAGGRRV